MPDEEIQGQPPVAEPSPVQPAAPAVEPTPQTPAQVPEKLAGKSAEEIATQYLELEKKLGEQGRELGELRARIPQHQPQPQYYPQPPTPPEKVEFDYGNPEISVERIVERRMEERERQRAMHESGRRATEAEVNFKVAKEIAVSRNTRLYEGIEADVEKAAQSAIRDYGMDPAMLRDPKTLDIMAANIRFQRGEWDRFQKTSPQPPNPSHSIVPNQTRPDAKAGVELSDEDRRWAKDNGLNEQEAKEIIEKEREREFGGGR